MLIRPNEPLCIQCPNVVQHVTEGNTQVHRKKSSIGQTAYSAPTIPVPLSMPSPTVQCYALIGSFELFKATSITHYAHTPVHVL